MKEYKIVLMGATGVGKTSIIRQLVKGFFCEGYEPRTTENFRKSITHMNEKCSLAIYDTAEVDEIPPIMEHYLRNSDGFILVYSVIDYSSFEYIKTVREQITSIKGTEQVPMVLVGNQGDLADDSRAVKKKWAAELAATWPNCRFIETTAEDSGKIGSIFKYCVNAIEELKFGRLIENPNGKIMSKIGNCSVM